MNDTDDYLILSYYGEFKYYKKCHHKSQTHGLNGVEMNLPEAERFFGNRLQVDDHGNGQRLVIL
jgi:hypothetical protein